MKLKHLQHSCIFKCNWLSWNYWWLGRGTVFVQKVTVPYLGCRGAMELPFPCPAALRMKELWLVSKAKQRDPWFSSVLQRGPSQDSTWGKKGVWRVGRSQRSIIGRTWLRNEKDFSAPPCYSEKEDLESGKRKITQALFLFCESQFDVCNL